jgi:pimeloyl-ACP methyl ester carboxylesterase
MRVAFRPLVALVLASLGGCVLRPTLTESFSFRPKAMKADRAAPAQWGWDAASLDTITRTDSAGSLLAWWGPATAPTRACAGVLLLHGKGKNRAEMLPLGRSLQQAGFSVLLPDYRGYGGVEGTPTTEGMFSDAALSYRRLRAQLGDSTTPIVVIGHSMGTALAARVAREHEPAATVYMSPFDRISTLVRARAGAVGPRLFDTTMFAFNPLDDASKVRGRQMVVVAGRDLLIRKSVSDAFIAGLSPAPSVLRDAKASHESVLRTPATVRAVTDSISAWTGCSIRRDADGV